MENKEIKEGMPAPDFELEGTEGSKIKLNNYIGKWVVLYFYPKDNTPGCTKEACSFRDSNTEFSSLNAVIIGISFDNIKSHQKFKEKLGLPFILLTDEDKKVSELYGTFAEKNLYGRKFFGIVRSTFLIDPEGKIKKIWRKVKVDGHIEDVLNHLKRISS